MMVDNEGRIRCAGGWIRECKNWRDRHPTGPVHWEVWDPCGKKIHDELPANELRMFLVQRGLLAPG